MESDKDKELASEVVIHLLVDKLRKASPEKRGNLLNALWQVLESFR
jgi:hypothetical protein